MVDNPYVLSSMEQTPTQQVRDDLDFPHSGIFKSLHQMARGNYAIRNFTTSNGDDLAISQSVSGTVTRFTVSDGSFFRDGKLVSYTSSTVDLASNQTADATNNVYLLLVINVSNTLSLRGDNTTTNDVADFIPGDILLAVIKIVANSSDNATNRPIQYLVTTDSSEKHMSIGYDSSQKYVEAMSITSDTAGEVTIATKVSDKDLNFTINDGGVIKTLMSLDASNDRVIMYSDHNSTALSLECTDGGTSGAPDLFMYRNSPSPANDDDVGQIGFSGTTTGGGAGFAEYASIRVKAVNVANTAEDGQLAINIVKDGAQIKEVITAGSEEVVINEDSLDIDFRVESDANAYAIHLDAANEKIAIMGDSTPTQTLELNGSFAGKVTTITGSTASYSVVATDYTIIGHSTATPCTLTLPAASSHLGRILNFHQLDTGVMLFAFTGSDEASGFIAGSNQDTDTGVSLTQYQGLSMVSDGVSRWCIIGQSGPQA